MIRLAGFCLIVVLMSGQVLATQEAQANYLQEFDITFWQTLPFAAFWANLIDRQLATTIGLAGAPHWTAILGAAALISAANAAFSAERAAKSELTTLSPEVK